MKRIAAGIVTLAATAALLVFTNESALAKSQPFHSGNVIRPFSASH